MKILILGLPGSGTSAVAQCYARAGFDPGGPTFERGTYDHEKLESIEGRAINRILLGGHGSWPSWRWHADFLPRNPFNDPELRALAGVFVARMDIERERWFFKNPESLLAWAGIWSAFPWDEVVGVYRHPEDSVRGLHSLQKACYRRTVWNRYAPVLAEAATRLVRFPDDIPDLAQALGVESPLREALIHSRSGYDPAARPWCAARWLSLEEKRWKIPESEPLAK